MTVEQSRAGRATVSLSRIQDDFQEYLLRGAAEIEQHVVATARVPIATRLAIYGDGYCLRLIEALQANYPAMAKLLGESEFAELGTAYVRANDSRFASIRYYGAGLSEFLATQPEYAAAPVLAELARWEWTMTEVFDAADAASIDASALAQVEPSHWGDLAFEFHPSVRRLVLQWNVPQIWRALTDDADRPQAALQGEPTSWLLWRQDLQTYFRSLELPESEALDLAQRHCRFGEICAGLARHFAEDEVPTRAVTYLRQWVESGLLTSVRAS